MNINQKLNITRNENIKESGYKFNNICIYREEELHLDLNDGGNEDLIKKNKKKKKLGSINIRITMKPMTKEEMNEVFLSLIIWDFI